MKYYKEYAYYQLDLYRSLTKTTNTASRAVAARLMAVGAFIDYIPNKVITNVEVYNHNENQSIEVVIEYKE